MQLAFSFGRQARSGYPKRSRCVPEVFRAEPASPTGHASIFRVCGELFLVKAIPHAEFFSANMFRGKTRVPERQANIFRSNRMFLERDRPPKHNLK